MGTVKKKKCKLQKRKGNKYVVSIQKSQNCSICYLINIKNIISLNISEITFAPLHKLLFCIYLECCYMQSMGFQKKSYILGRTFFMSKCSIICFFKNIDRNYE